MIAIDQINSTLRWILTQFFSIIICIPIELLRMINKFLAVIISTACSSFAYKHFDMAFLNATDSPPDFAYISNNFHFQQLKFFWFIFDAMNVSKIKTLAKINLRYKFWMLRKVFTICFEKKIVNSQTKIRDRILTWNSRKEVERLPFIYIIKPQSI